MITVISGTNRKGNRTLAFAKAYVRSIAALSDEKVDLLDMSTMENDWLNAEMYIADNQKDSISNLRNKYITPAAKFIFVIPEYNGTYPGIVKLFIDALSVKNYATNFKNKKTALVGVASGRGGNLRGCDHLADSLNHMGGITFPNKMPFSNIEALMDAAGNVTDEEALKTIREHVGAFLAF